MALLYYVIYSSAGGKPSAAQVKAGQDSTGSAAIAAGSETANTTTGEQIFATAASGLAAGTSYKVALVWSDGSTDSLVEESAAWETLNPQTVSVPVGGLTLTGYAPTVAATANQSVSVPTGSLSLTGYAPTVTATNNQTVAVPAGSLSLTGYAPTVSTANNQTVQVPAATLTLTGNAPTVVATANVAVAVPAGALTLTGYAPTVISGAHVVIDVPAGSLSLTGNAPTVSVSDNKTIAVPAGALTLTGNAPVVVASDRQTVAVPAGALNLTGYAPTVQTSGPQVVAVPVGGLTLVGYAPDVEVSRRSRGGATRPYRYVARIGGQLYFSDSLEELESALDAFEKQAQPRAKRKAQARTDTTPKQVARTAPKVQAVEVPDADREKVAQLIADANRRVRELYEAEARAAMIGRYIELEMIAREMDDEAAIVALSY